jgi:hypothetical protein
MLRQLVLALVVSARWVTEGKDAGVLPQRSIAHIGVEDMIW